jgi:hypothetical protein
LADLEGDRSLADSRSGWYADPWNRWPERYFENGEPTSLVRDGWLEGDDPRDGSGPPSVRPSRPRGPEPGTFSPPPLPPVYVARNKRSTNWVPKNYRQPEGQWQQPGQWQQQQPGQWQPQAGYGAAPPGYASQPPGYAPQPRYPPPPPGGAYYHPPGYQPYGYAVPRPKGGSEKTGPLPLHPMNLGDIIDGAFALFRANFKAIVIIVAVISGPIRLISAFASRNAILGVHNAFSNIGNPNGTTTFQTQTSSGAQTLATLLAALASLVLLPYVAGAICKLVAASYLGESLPAGQALGAAGRRVLPLFAAWFLVHIAEVGAGILLILPGLLVMSMFLCTAPAIVMENLGPIEGMRRSSQLNRGRIWPILGIALASGFVVSIIGNIIDVPFVLGAIAMGARWGWVLLFVGSLLSSLVTLSLTAVIATLIYFDGRIRKEGFDLQILARTLGR